jgi:hypothetical protein
VGLVGMRGGMEESIVDVIVMVGFFRLSGGGVWRVFGRCLLCVSVKLRYEKRRIRVRL